MTNHLCRLVVIFGFFAAPVCCSAAGLVRTVAELVTAVENAKDGDTIELAAGKFELERTLELKAGMALKGAGMDQTTVTHSASWHPATEALPDPEMRLEGLDTDAYLIRIRRDTQGVTISDLTLHGPAMHGAVFAWFHTGLHLHHLRIKDTLWCGLRTFGMKNAKIHDCEFVRNGVEIDHNLFDFDVQKDHGNLISAFGNAAAPGPASFHNNLVSNPGRGVMWMNEPYGKLEVRNNHIIARTTKEPRTDGLFGFNEKSGFAEFRFADNIIESEGTPRPLFRNDASGGARVENNQLVNIADTARYRNQATGKPQGPEQPLKFECGVAGELTVDGWKTRKTVAR